MQPVIMDVDMGVDDALALILALRSPELDLMGISVVSGNVPLEIGTRSALQILELLDRPDIPVFVGAGRPLQREPVRAQEVHGANGLGDVDLPEPEMLPAGDAVDFLIDGINSRPGEVMLVGTGPVTNLAMAEERRPGILGRARRLVVMGGVLRGEGNAGPGVEYNFHADPHAVQRVFRSGANIALIPLDVTRQVGLDAGILEARARAGSGPVVDFVRQASQSVIAYNTARGYAGIHLHDPLATAMTFEPELCRLETQWVDVDLSDGPEAGRLIRRETGGKEGGEQVECAVEVDAGRFLELFLHRVLDR